MVDESQVGASGQDGQKAFVRRSGPFCCHAAGELQVLMTGAVRMGSTVLPLQDWCQPSSPAPVSDIRKVT